MGIPFPDNILEELGSGRSPEDLQAALDSDPTAQAFFAGLTTSRRRGRWVGVER